MRDRRRGAYALALLAAAALAWTGCASRREARVERSVQLLADAGFRPVKADTPERAEALRRLPAGRVSEVMRNERTFYVFPDPELCQCLWVGTGDEYDAWRGILHQKKHPQPSPVPWNEGALGNGAMSSAGVWGVWPWWD
jgi:hypothetical protein